jgi:cephalosporin hydroxylase
MQLTILVCAFDMDRELPRTILSLSPAMQRGVEANDYEIIVVDNGSAVAVDEHALQRIAPNLRVVRFEPGNPSPVRAINMAMQSATSCCLALFIDGARLASPGIIAAALQAYRNDPTKIIGTMSFHLGPDVQMRSKETGYDQQVEDALLDASHWEEDGYALFDIAVLSGSSREGWFGDMKESNGVFLDRALWKKVGGLDERFRQPGGGIANLDFWARAVKASGNTAWTVLGEGTFHQIHGGAATSGNPAGRAAMFGEYKALNGKPFSMPPYERQYVGCLSEKLMRKFGGSTAEPTRQAYSVFDRQFAVDIPADLLATIQSGTMRSCYKGRKFLKNPFDLGIYLQLLQRLAPRTIIEVGASEGGSACWFRDMSDALGLNTEILTMDIHEPAEPIEQVSFFTADSTRPGETFPHARISAAKHPILVIEDSAHSYESVKAVLDYFDPHLLPGDYIVVEDGIVADLPAPRYRDYEDGPNRAVRDFLLGHPDSYGIDTELCDFYGRNATYCPNGWLVKK